MGKYLVICILALIAIFLFGFAGTGKQPPANITPLQQAPNGRIQPSMQSFQNQSPIKTYECLNGQVVRDPNLCPKTPQNNQETTSLSVPIPVPNTSASAITSPPSNMAGINTRTEIFGTNADPNMITLGPKLGSNPGIPSYATHHGQVFELKIHGTPVLAPIDMTLVGFQNNNGYLISGGQNIIRMDDLVLFFESASPDWPGMIIFVYHLYGSPLLRGHMINPDCSAFKEPRGENVIDQAQGRLFMGMRDYVTDKGNAGACQALIGYAVKRGELIGFAGTVPAPDGIGTHSFVDIGFKVSDTSENPFFGLKGYDTSGERQDKTGNRYLHWVQPSSFFYWKCFDPDADFPSGVLAYPFECGGYQLPAKQHDVNFKYTSIQ